MKKSIFDPWEERMTLRDYFAGQALVGITTYPETAGDTPEQTAVMAYMIADAMLEHSEWVEGREEKL